MNGKAKSRRDRRQLVDDVADTVRRSPLFTGCCYLCGAPCKDLYCHACSWAAGPPTSPYSEASA